MVFGKLLAKLISEPQAVAACDAAPVQDVAPVPAAGGYCAELLPGVPSNQAFQISSYGARLQANKAALAQACADVGAPPALHALFVAMAMVETNHMCASERDASKDGNSDGSANVSLFNLSVDLVQCTGCSQPPEALNDSLADAVAVLQAAIAQWGVGSTLDFVRGGRTGFQDHVSYGCGDYRRTVATILTQIDQDPSLLSDDRRVEVDLVHV